MALPSIPPLRGLEDVTRDGVPTGFQEPPSVKMPGLGSLSPWTAGSNSICETETRQVTSGPIQVSLREN